MRGLRQRLVAGQARLNIPLSYQINFLAVGLLMTPTPTMHNDALRPLPAPHREHGGLMDARNTVPRPPIVRRLGAPFLLPSCSHEHTLGLKGSVSENMEEMGTGFRRGHSIVSYSRLLCVLR